MLTDGSTSGKETEKTVDAAKMEEEEETYPQSLAAKAKQVRAVMNRSLMTTRKTQEEMMMRATVIQISAAAVLSPLMCLPRLHQES